MDSRMKRMIETIKSYGIRDQKILGAFESVPRHQFIPEYDLDEAYRDSPLPLKSGQSISQPYTVAFMLEALELGQGQSVLEIGSGSGWSAALIKHIVGDGRVITIERIADLAMFARENLKRAGLDVEVINDDGSFGYPEKGPYDRIVIAAACPGFPLPLVAQLKEDGLIVAPVGELSQKMMKGRKKQGSLFTEDLGRFSFVPLRGRHGFKE
jgi:protein-L-isoaspartate(D-aspartate) O-methyltransferase